MSSNYIWIVLVTMPLWGTVRVLQCSTAHISNSMCLLKVLKEWCDQIQIEGLLETQLKLLQHLKVQSVFSFKTKIMASKRGEKGMPQHAHIDNNHLTECIICSLEKGFPCKMKNKLNFTVSYRFFYVFLKYRE